MTTVPVLSFTLSTTDESVCLGAKFGVQKLDSKGRVEKMAFLQWQSFSDKRPVPFTLGIGGRLNDNHSLAVLLDGRSQGTGLALSREDFSVHQISLDYLYTNMPNDPKSSEAGICLSVGVGQNWGKVSHSMGIKLKEDDGKPVDASWTWEHTKHF